MWRDDSERSEVFKTEDVVILDREERYRERGIKEAIWERVENLSINKKGGLHFQLSNSNNIVLAYYPYVLPTVFMTQKCNKPPLDQCQE